MTSTSKQSRHLACVLCRDRKVKCDGARPSCEKCIKAGETCTYSVNSKASVAELQETILRLNKRIEQAEANQGALMAQHYTLSNCVCQLPLTLDAPLLEPFAMFDQQHPAQNRQMTFSSYIEGLPAGSGSLDNSGEGNTTRFPFEPRAGHLLPLGDHPGHAGLKTTTARIKADITPSPIGSKQDDRAETSPPPCPAFVGDSHDSNHPRLPSLRNVKEWAWRTSTGLDRGGLSGEDDHADKEDAAEHLLEEFISLVASIESVQYDIIGVADTAAMYSSYCLRQANLDGKQNVEGLKKLIETLEHRMREISEIASQRILGQTRRSRESVEVYDTYRDRIKKAENEQRRCARARSDFFDTRYDLSCPLSQQA